MNNYEVQAEQLSEGQIVTIRGKLAYSRLTQIIDGEDLARVDMRKAQYGMEPVGRPHTTVTINQAEVVYKDPANPTREEKFVSERRYASKSNPNSGPNWSHDNKSVRLPIIATLNEEGKAVQDVSGRELANGLDVTLVLRVYKPKTRQKRGLSLDQVIVNEPVRYYGSAIDDEELAARGIVFAEPPKQVNAQENQSSTDAPVQTQVSNDGFAGPAPMETPAPQGQTAPMVQSPQPAVAPEPVAQPTEAVVQPQPVAAPAAPEPVAQTPEAVSPPQPAQSDAADQPTESLEEKLARITAENEALRNQQSRNNRSAVHVDPDDPWATDGRQPVQAGIQPG